MKLSVKKRQEIIAKECEKRFNKKIYKLEREFDKAVAAYLKKNAVKYPERLREYINKTNLYEFQKKDQPLLKEAHVRICGSISTRYPQKRFDRLAVKVDATMQAILKELVTIHSSKAEFKKDLRKVLFSYNTDTALLKDVPELKKHFTNVVNVKAIVPIEDIKKVKAYFAKA